MSRGRLGHRLAAASAICGIVCLAGSGPALGADTFDGAYTGTRVLTKGSDQTCPVSEAVSTTEGGVVLISGLAQSRNQDRARTGSGLLLACRPSLRLRAYLRTG